MEFGEDPSETAIRERLKETGYRVGSLGLMTVLSDTTSTPGTDVHSIRIIFSGGP